MTHLKALVVNDLWSVIGTTNFDNRSFEHNDEVNVAIRDKAVTARITRLRIRCRQVPRDHANGVARAAALGKARRHGRLDSRAPAVTYVTLPLSMRRSFR